MTFNKIFSFFLFFSFFSTYVYSSNLLTIEKQQLQSFISPKISSDSQKITHYYNWLQQSSTLSIQLPENIILEESQLSIDSNNNTPLLTKNLYELFNLIFPQPINKEDILINNFNSAQRTLELIIPNKLNYPGALKIDIEELTPEKTSIKLYVQDEFGNPTPFFKASVESLDGEGLTLHNGYLSWWKIDYLEDYLNLNSEERKLVLALEANRMRNWYKHLEDWAYEIKGFKFIRVKIRKVPQPVGKNKFKMVYRQEHIDAWKNKGFDVKKYETKREGLAYIAWKLNPRYFLRGDFLFPKSDILKSA